MAKMGRPPSAIYSDELADKICERVAADPPEPLYAICGTDGIPSPFTVYEWLAKYPYFSNRYQRAKDILADRLAFRAQQIGTSPAPAQTVIYDKGNLKTITADNPVARRLAFDALTTYAKQLSPKKYWGTGAPVAQDDGEGNTFTIKGGLPDA